MTAEGLPGVTTDPSTALVPSHFQSFLAFDYGQ